MKLTTPSLIVLIGGLLLLFANRSLAEKKKIDPHIKTYLIQYTIPYGHLHPRYGMKLLKENRHLGGVEPDTRLLGEKSAMDLSWLRGLMEQESKQLATVFDEQQDEIAERIQQIVDPQPEDFSADSENSVARCEQSPEEEDSQSEPIIPEIAEADEAPQAQVADFDKFLECAKAQLIPLKQIIYLKLNDQPSAGLELFSELTRGRAGLADSSGMICGVHLGKLSAQRQANEEEEMKLLMTLLKLNRSEAQTFLRAMCLLEEDLASQARTKVSLYLSQLRSNIYFNNKKPEAFEKAWPEFHEKLLTELSSTLTEEIEMQGLIDLYTNQRAQQDQKDLIEVQQRYQESCQNVQF